MNETIDFVRNVYRDVDAMDPRRLTAHLTPDCTFVFANADPVTGSAAIESHLRAFMEMFDGMTHEIDAAWRAGDVVISRLRVAYRRKDGIRKVYPAAVIWRMRGELIGEFTVFIDASTLFSAEA
ncbi:nuclear transport factor 2 family protein [Trinickia terrae]|uniref:Nuclear transport factor 2 family protein n=1 Tax=Trinickia terrae TaxID=2571161 RepID=A0A4U1IEX7_9BURK|nr:nuclear transport factor 2 family protein [Trinickia terrae]TKC92264.1 nuclear transport factor 2 family protein [Trinickia terrae]